MVSTTTPSRDEGAVVAADPEEAGKEEEHVHGGAAEEVHAKGGDTKPAEGGRQAAEDAGEVEVLEVASSEDEQEEAGQKRGIGDQDAVGYVCLVCGEAASDRRPLFKCSTLHCGGLVHLKCIRKLECFRESPYTPADGVSMEDAILTRDDIHTCFCCFWVEGMPPPMRKRTSLGVAPDPQSCSECNKEMQYDAMGRDVELLKCPLPNCPGVFHYACVAKHGRISIGRCDPSIVVRCSDGCAAVDASHVGSEFEICGGSQRVKAQVERARRSSAAAAAVSTGAHKPDAAYGGAAELRDGTEEGKEDSDMLATREDDAGGGYQDPDEGDLKPAAVSHRKRRAKSSNVAAQKPSKTRKTVSVLKKAASKVSAHDKDDASCGDDEGEDDDGGVADVEDEEDKKKFDFPYKTRSRSHTRKRSFTPPSDDSSSSIASSNRGSQKQASKAVPSKPAVRVEEGKLFGWNEAVSLVRVTSGRLGQGHTGFAVHFEDRQLAEEVLQLGGVVLPVVIDDDDDD